MLVFKEFRDKLPLGGQHARQERASADPTPQELGHPRRDCYRHHDGIRTIKQKTDVLRRWLPKAGIGVNFSPQHGDPGQFYQGEVFRWVSCFRDEGPTLPWSEDDAWGVPLGTQRMNGINLDLFRAGLTVGVLRSQILARLLQHRRLDEPLARQGERAGSR